MRHAAACRHKTRFQALALAALAALGTWTAAPPAVAAAEGQVRLRAVPVQVPGTSDLRAIALGADGTVGGTVNVGGRDRGFLWNDGIGVVSHPANGALASTIMSVTDIGVGVGWSTLPGGSQRPTRFAPFGAVAEALPAGFSSGAYLAADGDLQWQVAQFTSTAGVQGHYLRRGTGPWILMNGIDDVTSVNRSGTVVGSVDDPSVGSVPVVWRHGVVQALPTLPAGRAGRVMDLNDAGTMVGLTTTTGLRWSQGVPTLLEGPLGATATARAEAINSAGIVVGSTRAPGALEVPTWWRPDGTPVAINDYVVGVALPASTTGVDINDRGQVLLVGGGNWLLTPTGTLGWRGGNGSFADGARWDSGLGLAPSELLDVVIASPGTARIELDRAAAARSLRVGEATGVGRATLAFAQGATLTSAGPVLVEATGVLAGNGRIATGVLNRGTIAGTAAEPVALAFAGELDNRGLVTGSGRIDTSLVNRGSSGGVRVGAGESLHLAGSVHSNADGGRIEVRGGGELRFTGNLTNQGGAFVRLDDATLRLDNGLVNGGVVQIGFGGASVFGEVVNNPAVDVNRGRIIASGGAQVTFWDRVVNQGEMRASAGAQLVYFGPVSGSGLFSSNGGGYHRFEGGFSPGSSPAIVTLGDAELASVLTLELGGLLPGLEHDQLRFEGRVLFDVGSTLQLVALDGFTFAAGQRWQLFDFAQAPDGRFSALDLPALPGSLFWDTSDLYAGGSVAVVPEPASALLMLLGAATLLARRRAGPAAT